MTYKQRAITPVIDRLMARVVKTESGCWIWTGSTSHKGYGKIGIKKPTPKTLATHVVTYTHYVGPVPKGLELDHKCKTPLCCNPDHLEPVTHKENVNRGSSPGAVIGRTGYCRRGHEMSEDNWYYLPDGSGRRQCRTCRNESRKRAKEKP